MLSTPTDLTYGVLGGGNPGTETSSVACRNAHSEEGLILSATFCPWTIPRYSGCRAPETRDVPMWVESHWNRELKKVEDNYGLCVKDILWLKPLDKQLAAPLETFLSLARPSPPPPPPPPNLALFLPRAGQLQKAPTALFLPSHLCAHGAFLMV